MHDPKVVAFEIRRPWPSRSGFGKKGVRWSWTIHRKHAEDHDGWNPRRWWHPGSWSPFVTAFGRNWYFPALVVVWHEEPGGRDSGAICKHHRRWQDDDGKWHSKVIRRWRWHVWHWRIQLPPVQEARRWLFQRCAWCNGPSRKGAVVNCSHSWDGPRDRWWKSTPGLYHMGCSSAVSVARACLCDVPMVDGWNGAFGTCATCGKSYRSEAAWISHRRAVELVGVPVKGQRWTWPAEVNYQDIERELAAIRAGLGGA